MKRRAALPSGCARSSRRASRSKLGRLHLQPVGPHTKPMYEVAFAGAEFAAVVPWLMLNRGGLSILVHPNTDDPVADHEVNPLWLGEAVAIDVEFLRAVVKRRSLPSGPRQSAP